MSLKLQDIKGIGPATEEKLIEKGVTSPEQLAVMRPEELKEILGITLKAAKDIINDAKDKALSTAIPVRTFGQHEEHLSKIVQRIPTGSKQLDEILGGGWRTEAIHLLKGEYASGKTQLCFQAAINCLKYLKRKVIWIETETGTFSPKRLEELATAVGIQIDKNNDFIYVPSVGITTPYNQFLAYERALKEMENKQLNVGLFVVDSFNATFREYYSGREMLPDRAREEARHLGFLDIIATKYNMAIILTGQVMDIPDQGGQLGEKVKTGHIRRTYGGNILHHWSTYIISLTQIATDVWEAVLADSPEMPRKSCRFKITPSGIKDIFTK
ncbi:MAG: helix-hairpin-helix domain-containing protein [Ignisphaera sp.]